MSSASYIIISKEYDRLKSRKRAGKDMAGQVRAG
jgi:hypothetical protein